MRRMNQKHRKEFLKPIYNAVLISPWKGENRKKMKVNMEVKKLKVWQKEKVNKFCFQKG